MELRHGKGILLRENGDVYEGEFKNDMKDGFGILQLKIGDLYKG